MEMEEKSGDPHQDSQSPSFMTPKRPVMDEPLETGVPGKDSPPGASEPAQVLQAPADESARAMEPPKNAQEEPNKRSPISTSPMAPLPLDEAFSPYFPRGIFEDAAAVEAYYGRDVKPATAQITDEPASTSQPISKQHRRVWMGIIALLLILVLVLLAATGKIFLPFL